MANNLYIFIFYQASCKKSTVFETHRTAVCHTKRHLATFGRCLMHTKFYETERLLLQIFNEMIAIHIPILFIHKIIVTVKVELIHSEYDWKILWLPLLFIGITICHACLLHNIAASWIVSVMRRGNIRQTVFFNLFYDRFRCFCNNSPVPKFFTKSITKIMVFFHADMDVTDRKIIFFQTDSIRITLWLFIY